MRTEIIAKRLLAFWLSLAWLGIVGAKELEITIERVSQPPVLDGNLDDEVWKAIEPITGFMQYDPEEGVPPSEPTALYIAYDNDNFYLAFKCYDSETEQIRSTLTQRESWEDDDCIGFAFDTFNSEREAFLFNLNPYGIPCDFVWNLGRDVDNGWDADLRSSGKIHDDHYCIEVAVPFHSLRMPAQGKQVWGFYALRCIKRKSEMDIWPPRTHAISNNLAQASILRGIEGVKTGSHFAILPYFFTSHERGDGGDDRTTDAGFDFRYGITSNFMLDVTVNPDYSQIEADPDRIELSERYIQLLPEKRPFFTEGIDVFRSNQALFYSRRIANPVAGLKLTGKTGRTRIGVLSAVNEETSDAKTYYNHFRAKTDILDESSVGLLMTNRDEADTRRHNRIISLDSVLRFQSKYSFKSQFSRSYTRDDSTDYGTTGYNLCFERFGAHSYSSVWYEDFPDEFEAQSGSMWEVLGYRTIGAHQGVFIRKPVESINVIEFHADARGRYDHEDGLEEDYFEASAEMSLDGVWTKLEFYKNHEFVSNHDFRYHGFEYEMWSTPSRYLDQYVSIIWGTAPYYDEECTGWKYRLIYGATLKPLRRVVYNLNLSREDFYEEFGGKRSYLQTIVWNKLSIQVIPSMFVRGIFQYNSLERRSDASMLFAFEYDPLSNIYVGANFNDFSRFEDAGNSAEFFAKIGYLWRL